MYKETQVLGWQMMENSEKLEYIMYIYKIQMLKHLKIM